MTINYFVQTYCVCPDDLSKPGFDANLYNLGNTVAGINSFNYGLFLPKIDLEANFSQQEAYNMNKEEVYFSLLKDYKYETIPYYDEKKQREVPQYK